MRYRIDDEWFGHIEGITDDVDYLIMTMYDKVAAVASDVSRGEIELGTVRRYQDVFWDVERSLREAIQIVEA